jgi:lipopolysaccharide transport system permease protein
LTNVTSISSQKLTAPRPEPPNQRPAQPMLRNAVEWSDSLSAYVRELLHHRDLLYLVTQREIKVRYKQTVLGALWAVLQPFSLMVVFTVFFSLYAGLPSDGIPYPLFAYAALLPWTFFSTALSFAVPSLIVNSHIITKVYFPREIVPLSSVFAALVDFAVASTVFVGLLAFYGISPTWNVLYVIPILMLQLTFTMALCLLLAAFTVLYRDVRFTLPLLLQIWMFATPILYPLSVVPESGRGLYLTLNPMAVVVDAYRRVLLQGQPPDLMHLASTGMISLVLLLLGYRYFKRLEREFADIV